MRFPRVEPKNVVGFADKVTGLTKEFVGHTFDSRGLIEAGEAQQAKGSEKLKALREQGKAEQASAKAKAHEAKASVQDRRQQAAENS
jgi:uncharacterized protein YjbJ (UPF0337 family)